MTIKKITITLILLCLAINIFARDFTISAGAGEFAGYTFTRYTLTGGDLVSEQKMDRFNIGAFIFVDFTYGYFSFGYHLGTNRYSESMTGMMGIDIEMLLTGFGIEQNLTFALMGKYPFQITRKFSLFPMLGVEFHRTISQLRMPDSDGRFYDRTNPPPDRFDLMGEFDKDGEPYMLSAWNSWWINVGGGADYNITDRLYFRSELIFGFRLPTSFEMGALEMLKTMFEVDEVKMGGLTGSPTLKLALGYKIVTFETGKRRAARREQLAMSNEQLEEGYEQEEREEQLAVSEEQITMSKEQLAISKEQIEESYEQLEESFEPEEVEEQEESSEQLEVSELLEESYEQIEESEDLLEESEEQEEIVELFEEESDEQVEIISEQLEESYEQKEESIEQVTESEEENGEQLEDSYGSEFIEEYNGEQEQLEDME